jgi:HPt (histidine-containing phosphotransfer) domain-containing protein
MELESVIDLPTFEQIKNDMGVSFMSELVEAYCMETPLLMARLQQALADQDAESFRMAAHSIKSSSNSLGALEFGAIARELEILGREGRLADASPRVKTLIACYDPVQRALRSLCND